MPPQTLPTSVYLVYPDKSKINLSKSVIYYFLPETVLNHQEVARSPHEKISQNN